MSMLSSQVEELRKAAMTYRMLGRYTLANVLLEAAESITKLRGALSVASVDYRQLSDENAKLRLLVRNLIRATHPADRAELIANAAELGVEVKE